MKDQYQGDGFGSDVFAAEVKGAVEAGYSYIETHAARYDVAPPNGFNGYYTWIALGYDQTLATIGSSTVRKNIQRLVPGAKSVLDMMDAEKVDLTEPEKDEVRAILTKLAGFALTEKIKKSIEKRIAKTEFNGSDWWLAHGGGVSTRSLT